MKTTTQSTVDCPSFIYNGMNNKKKKYYSDDFIHNENGLNTNMNQQAVPPPAHVWDRIEMILNNQSKAIINHNSMVERNKNLLSPRKK